MKTKYTSAASIIDAKECAKSVGVNFVEEDIDIYVDLFKKRLSKRLLRRSLGCRGKYSVSDQRFDTDGNL